MQCNAILQYKAPIIPEKSRIFAGKKEKIIMLRAYVRYFENSDGYKDFKDIAYFDSLAFTAQEFLYTKRAEDNYENYNMINHIKLYDLMTLVVYFIKASTTDFGRATITGYIEDLEKDKRNYQHCEEIEYTKENALLVTHASIELVISILWVSYIYIKFRSDLEDGKDEMWCNAAKTIYNLMEDYYPYKKDIFNKSFIITNITPALKFFLTHWLKHHSNKKSDKQPDYQSQEKLSESTNKIQALQQIIEKQDKAIQDLLQPVEDIPAVQKVRMELAFQLLQAAGMTDEILELQGNKQKAATVMSLLLNIQNNNSRENKAQTCATYLSARDLSRSRHQDTIEKINPLLKDLGIDITL